MVDADLIDDTMNRRVRKRKPRDSITADALHNENWRPSMTTVITYDASPVYVWSGRHAERRAQGAWLAVPALPNDHTRARRVMGWMACEDSARGHWK